MLSVKAMPCTAITTGLGTGGAQTPNGSKSYPPDSAAGTLGRHRGTDLGQVQPGGEVLADAVDDPDAQVGVAAQHLVGRADRVDGGQVPRVALVRPVDPDQQDVPAALDHHGCVRSGCQRHCVCCSVMGR